MPAGTERTKYQPLLNSTDLHLGTVTHQRLCGSLNIGRELHARVTPAVTVLMDLISIEITQS